MVTFYAVTVCLARAATEAAKDGGLFEKFVESKVWEDIVVTLADGMEALIKTVIVGLSSAEKVKTILFIAVAAATTGIIYEIAESGSSSQTGPIAKINIPAAGLGASPKKEGCNGSEKKNADSVGG
jgi:hypothetical protein